jgi:Tol biopolymer transport system component
LYKFNGNSFTWIQDLAETTGYYNNNADWSPDGKYLVVGIFGGAPSKLYQFDGSSLSYLSDVDSNIYNTSFAKWSPDGKYLILANQGLDPCKFYQFNGNHFTPLGNVDNSTYLTNAAAWSPDGHYLILSNDRPAQSKLYRFEGNSFTFLNNIAISAGYYATFSPDGKYLVLGNYGEQSKLYPVPYTFDTSPQGFSNGIIFGNSALGSDYDLNLRLLSGANVCISGHVWYDDVN